MLTYLTKMNTFIGCRKKIFFLTFSYSIVLFLVALCVLFVTRIAQADESETIIDNPLNTDTIPEFLAAVLGVVLVLSVPIIIFFLFYAGFLYVTAQGNSEQVRNATRAFMYAVIGGLIVLGATVLISIIQTFTQAVIDPGAEIDFNSEE